MTVIDSLEKKEFCVGHQPSTMVYLQEKVTNCDLL